MKQVKVIHENFTDNENVFDGFIENFQSQGIDYGDQDRNSLKLFDFEGRTINIKSFKIPNLLNQIVYRFFRKSKASRSYNYACKLIELEIGTPQPIGYYEFRTAVLFKNSFYLSAHLEDVITYRYLTFNREDKDHEAILRSFTRFTFALHEKNVHFLDHSPGNTLIRKTEKGYEFYLVDLNRMKFEPMDFESRIKNFSKLTIHKSMVEIMSDEYAKCSGEDYDQIFELMWRTTTEFQKKFHRKRKLKKKVLFFRTKN
jgi:hypothetical protein